MHDEGFSIGQAQHAFAGKKLAACEMALARLLRHAVPNLNVLAFNEVPESRRIRVVAAVGR